MNSQLHHLHPDDGDDVTRLHYDARGNAKFSKLFLSRTEPFFLLADASARHPQFPHSLRANPDTLKVHLLVDDENLVQILSHPNTDFLLLDYYHVPAGGLLA